MTRWDKLVDRILRGTSDADVGFDDLCALLTHLGFGSRVRGSHHVFSKPGIAARITLQRDGANAKPYQVRQIRTIIVKYKLGSR
jgi:predicted RNA binding protein YcfA (HicA-like mRNA interferase family)